MRSFTIHLILSFLFCLASILTSFTLCFAQNCPNIDTIQLHIQSSFLSVSNSGQSLETFECQTQQDSIWAQSLGSAPIKLDYIFILHRNSTIPPQFFFDNGSDSLQINKSFSRSTRQFFHVNYIPTIPGIVSDTIVCQWDSSGIKKIFTWNILTGTGKLDRDMLSPMQLFYTANINDSINIPLTLSNSLSVDDQAMGITFDVSYPAGFLELNKNRFDYDQSLSDAIAPQISNDGAGNENVLFTLKCRVPITHLSPLLTLHFLLTGAKDTVVPLSISNVQFWGRDYKDTLCYILTSAQNSAIHITDSISIENNLDVAAIGNKEVAIIANHAKMNSISIKIFNLLGSEIASWSGIASGNFRKTFSMQVSGIYFIKVTANGKEYFFKRLL